VASGTRPAIVWFRDDLRVADNPALTAAVASGHPIVCVYIHDEESPGSRPIGGASRWWLHHSLVALRSRLEQIGSSLLIRRGAAQQAIAELISETDAAAMFWNRRYGASERAVDEKVKSAARQNGLEASSFGANLLFEPWTITTGAGTPFSVCTPFWRACLSAVPPRMPLDAPTSVSAGSFPSGLSIDELGLLPTRPDWAGGLRDAWTPGEDEAHASLAAFLNDDVADYKRDRDTPGIAATSRLSPRLRWGELSPHQVWHAASDERTAANAEGATTFLAELGWREFAYHTLFQHPRMATDNIREEYNEFPWPRLHPSALKAWQQGRTGIPLVDAGMRELWQTGTMHNRVRMVVASFSPRTSSSTGAKASSGSGTRSSTPIPPTTRSTGSGSPEAGRMPHPTSVCSTRNCSVRNSTRTATTSAGGSPNGRLPSIRSRSSTWPTRGALHWRPTTSYVEVGKV